MRYFFVALVLFIIAIFGIGYYVTFANTISANEQVFAAGTLPEYIPNGQYVGKTDMIIPFWEGQSFNAKTQTGINNFRFTQIYRFGISVGTSLTNPKLSVITLDYNKPYTTLPLRPFLAELVQTKDGTFLGKLYLRIIPGHPFILGFYTLSFEHPNYHPLF